MIYKNIKKYAKEKGMTIKEVECRAGLTENCVYKWKDHSPTVRGLQKVANVLEVTMDELLKE